MLRRVVITTILVAGAAAPGLGQPTAPRRCDVPPPPAFHRERTVYLTARRVVRGVVDRREPSRELRPLLQALLNEVGTEIVLPAAVEPRSGADLLYQSATPSRARRPAADTLLMPEVGPYVRLVLRAGAPSDSAVLEPSSFPTLDSALVRALRAAHRASGLSWILPAGAMRGDTLPVAIELATDSGGVSAPVARLALPHWIGTPVVALRPGAVLRYPEEARLANREGSVLVHFVVGTDGTVDLRTLDVRRGDPVFTAAVAAAMPRMRFVPAVAGGCAVRMRVQQPFEFALQREPLPTPIRPFP